MHCSCSPPWEGWWPLERKYRSLGLKSDHHPLQTNDTMLEVQACFTHDVQVLILNVTPTRSDPLFETHLKVGGL